MIRPVGLAFGTFIILLGLASFTVRGTTWRKDAWNEWRSEWQPTVVVEEKTPWILLGVGTAVMIFTKAVSGAKES